MSRLDLDRIQAQLKVAIQSHQLLVLKMKSDPQNAELKDQLHMLQAEITNLSERQKSVVQQLRSELVKKKVLPPVAMKTFAHAGMHVSVPSKHVVQTAPTNLSLKCQLNNTHNNNRDSKLHPPAAHQHAQIMASLPTKSAVKRAMSPLPPAPTSPLIKVPHYSLQKTSRAVTSVGGSTKSPHHASSAMPSQPSRKQDLDINSFKRSSLDKKELAPAERKKLEYMASLDLVTLDILKELQSKRSERKRRSTANPQFSYSHFEPASDSHDDYCAACGRSGELLMCDTCSLVYHLQCLDPPLTAIPQGTWSCPKCEVLNKQTGIWPGTLALVHSYLVHRSAKQDEKGKLAKQNEELELERIQLESKATKLTDTLALQVKEKHELVAANRSVQQSVDQLKNFIKVFQTA